MVSAITIAARIVAAALILSRMYAAIFATGAADG
jgi:hypothetical protein